MSIGLPNYTGDSNRFGRGVCYGGGKAGKAPTPPDPKVTSAAQTSSNVNTAVANSILNNSNQTTPYGNVQYTQGASQQIPDGNGGFVSVPSWSINQTLSPAEQQKLDASNRAEIGMTNLAADYTGRIADATAKPFSMEGMPAAPQYDENYRQQQLAAILQRNQPQQQQDQARLDQRLADQGIGIGNEAYGNAQRDLSTRTNDFRLGADINAGNAAAQVFGLQGQTHDRAIQDALTQRNQPLNEVSALLGTGGVNQPNFINPQSQQIQPTDVSGNINNAYQQQLAIWQSKQQQAGGALGGIFGLAGAIGGGAARGLFGSDRRIKRDIRQIGTLANGLPWYRFRFIGDDTLREGLMAQDVMLVRPASVVDIGGVLHVHYPTAMV